MSEAAKQLLEQVLALPEDERQRLILQLIQVLQQEQAAASPALDPEERAKLDTAIHTAWQEAQAGQGRPGHEVLRMLDK